MITRSGLMGRRSLGALQQHTADWILSSLCRMTANLRFCSSAQAVRAHPVCFRPTVPSPQKQGPLLQAIQPADAAFLPVIKVCWRQQSHQ